MKIMGIDFDTKQFAYGVLNKNKYISSNTIRYSCPVILKDTLSYIIQQEKPDIIGLEQVYVSQNNATALQLAEVLGMLKLIISLHNLKLSVVNSRSAKAAVGATVKKQVKEKVIKLLKIPENIKLDEHQADALAVAYFLYKGERKWK